MSKYLLHPFKGFPLAYSWKSNLFCMFWRSPLPYQLPPPQLGQNTHGSQTTAGPVLPPHLYHARCCGSYLEHSCPPVHVCLINTAFFPLHQNIPLWWLPTHRLKFSVPIPPRPVPWGQEFSVFSFHIPSTWPPASRMPGPRRPFAELQLVTTPSFTNLRLYSSSFLISFVTLLLKYMKGWISIFIMTFRKSFFSKMLMKTLLW